MVEKDSILNKFNFTKFVDVNLVNSCCINGGKKLNEEVKRLETFCTKKHFDHVMTKKDFFESKNTRELCRNGIPYQYIRPFILKMFNCENEDEEGYKIKLSKVFKDRDRSKLNDYVPYLTGNDNFIESLPQHFLNSSGIQAVKEVQWMLNNVVPTMEHTPILIQINSLLHMFMDSFEVYYVLRNLININFTLKETYKIRWHMRFNFDENAKVISSIVETLDELGGKQIKIALKHFQDIHFSTQTLIEDLIFKFFTLHFNFEGLMRLLCFYFREGTKALYRITFALITTTHLDILEIKDKDSVIQKFREISKKVVDYDKLFELAFGLNLTRNNNKYDFQPVPEGDKFSNRRSCYYLPNVTILNKSTRILNEENLIWLWSMFPFSLKIKDMSMIFSTQVNGYSLSTLYSVGEALLKKNLNSANDYVVLFMVETTNDEIFGGLMSRLILGTNKNGENPEFLYLISILPNRNIYEVEEKQETSTVLADDQQFLFGIGDHGSTLRLDSSLNHGYNYEAKIFKSPILTKDKSGEYTIKHFEVYTLN